MPARPVLVLLLLLAAAGALLLASRSDPGAGDADAVSRSTRQHPAPPLLAQTSGAESTPEASLQGRAVDRPEALVSTGVLVRVEGPTGHAMAGLEVRASWIPTGSETAIRASSRTGDDGLAHLADVPQDGSATVETSFPGTSPDASTTVTGPEARLRLERGMLFEVHFVDAESGRPVEAVLTAGRAVSETRAVPTTRPGLTHRMGMPVAAPEGFVAWERDTWTVAVGQWTKVLEAVYPLRREMDVRVRVLDHRGRPEPEASVTGFSVAGRAAASTRADPLGPGAYRLRGVPYLRGETLSVGATAPGLEYPEWRETPLPEHPADRTEVTIQLPAPGSQELQDAHTIGIGGGCGSSRFCGRSRGPHGVLAVRVRRRDGSPASGALCFVDRRRHRLDEHGVLRLERSTVGEHDVSIQTIGLLPVSGKVTVEEGRVARLELREPKGGALEVRVTDVDGAPLPFAELRVHTPSKQPWIDEHGGVQRLDPFVDHRGRRDLTHVETGTITLEATWGGREGSVRLEVHEGRTARATIVLRRPARSSAR